MTRRILRAEEAGVRSLSHGERYACTIATVGMDLGSQKLGFNVTTIPPGKRSFPFHAHMGNEEMFYILEGEGSVRIAGETHRIRRGDFISLPPGRDSAHQILNDSGAPLVFIAVSTMEVPEVVEYPDTGKLGVTTGTPGGRPPGPDSIRHFAFVKDGVDYWDGEE